MTVYAWPTINRRITQFDWSLVSNTQSFQSPLSGATQTVEMPGARWRAVFSFSALDATDSAALRSFLVKLRGQSGRFTLHNLAKYIPSGNYVGSNPSVLGAGQTGTSLTTNGWLANITGALKAGDYFTVNGELKMAVEDVNSDGAGAATVVFEPPLRSSPANAAFLTLTKPTATFRLDEDAVRWVTSAPMVDSIVIACTEAW